MKIDNEYVDGEKRYIRSIRKCVCSEKIGDYYALKCKIIQRGEHEYAYKPGSCCLKKDFRGLLDNKKLWLTEHSETQANTAVGTMNAVIEKVQNRGYIYESQSDNKLAIYYEHKHGDEYEVILRVIDSAGVLRYVYYDALSIGTILHEATWYADGVLKNLLIDSKGDTIETNPFYIAAKKGNDERLQKQLKLYYRIATEKECTWLSKLFRRKILPSLPESFDKVYYVDSDTISVKILHDSGYVILHRPYFAMKDSTHSKWQLNPHKKEGVDAASVHSESISFREYLDMIESNQVLHD